MCREPVVGGDGLKEMRMAQVPAEAVEALRAFLDASGRQDMQAMSARVTRQTLASGKLHGPPMSVRYELGVEQMIRQMTEWFDGAMFAEWQPLFEQIVSAGVPLRGRLRSVRIEEAKQPKNRVIVLDGSDLVYRLNPAPGGTLGNEELAAVLPGVFAGLPARIDSTICEYRVLPVDGEALTLEFYRERWVPRWMRRIRELLRKPVKLEADWARAADVALTAPQLPLWGLNRVYGGIAYACLDPVRKEQLRRELDTVELAVGASVTRRFARYVDGKLSIGICAQGGGDTPGCYEHEIAQALAGSAV
jgi:hypothetical protein